MAASVCYGVSMKTSCLTPQAFQVASGCVQTWGFFVLCCSLPCVLVFLSGFAISDAPPDAEPFNGVDLEDERRTLV